jgi:hypothetical protein
MELKRNLAEGVVDVCCHRVQYWYDIGRFKLNDDDLEYLKEEAETRAKEMINIGCASGDLCCLLTEIGSRRQEREFHGWWNIEKS